MEEDRTRDSALLERWLKRRDADAFGEIVSRHVDMVYSASQRIVRNAADAEDIAQECFLKLARSRAGIKTSLAGWLHRLATNASLNLLKQEKRRRRREEEYVAAVQRRVAGWNEIQTSVDEAITNLPAGLAELVVRHYFERETYDSIARDLGMSRRMVVRRVEKAIGSIRRHLGRAGVGVSATTLAAVLQSRAAAGAAPATLTRALARVALSGTVPALGESFASAAVTTLGGLTIMKNVLIALTAGLLMILAIVFWPRVERDDSGPEPSASLLAEKADLPRPPRHAEGGGEPRSTETPAVPSAAPITMSSATISGIVLDGDERPVSGATIELWRLPSDDRAYLPPYLTAEEPAFRTRTREDGTFLTQALELGYPYWVRASKDDRGTSTERVRPGGRVIIRLADGARIYGSIHGMPPGANEHVAVTAHGDTYREGTLTDEHGDYELEGAPPGLLLIAVRAVAFEDAWKEVSVEAGNEYRLDFDLERGGTLEGLVVSDETGQPVPGAEVFANAPLKWTRTDDEGRFRLPGLRDDERAVTVIEVRARGYSPYLGGVRQGDFERDLVARLEGGRSIRGRVADERAGNALRGVTVVATQSLFSKDLPLSSPATAQRATTNEEGVFELVDLPAAAHDLSLDFRKVGYGAQKVYVTRSTHAGETLDIGEVFMGPGTALEGQVVDTDGEPVAGASVELSPSMVEARAGDGREKWRVFDDGQGRSAAFATRTDREGRFRLEDVPVVAVPESALKSHRESAEVARRQPELIRNQLLIYYRTVPSGPLHLRAASDGYRTLETDLAAPDPETDLVVELEAQGLRDLIVTARNEWGAAVDGADIRLETSEASRSAETRRLGSGRTDADGVFRTQFFTRGEALLGVSRRGYRLLETTIDLSESRIVKVRLAGVRTIKGTVTATAASDGSMRLAFATAPAAVLRTTDVAGDASFTFGELPPGNYVVWTADRHGQVSQAEANVAAGDVMDLTLR